MVTSKPSDGTGARDRGKLSPASAGGEFSYRNPPVIELSSGAEMDERSASLIGDVPSRGGDDVRRPAQLPAYREARSRPRGSGRGAARVADLRGHSSRHGARARSGPAEARYDPDHIPGSGSAGAGAGRPPRPRSRGRGAPRRPASAAPDRKSTRLNSSH